MSKVFFYWRFALENTSLLWAVAYKTAVCAEVKDIVNKRCSDIRVLNMGPRGEEWSEMGIKVNELHLKKQRHLLVY